MNKIEMRITIATIMILPTTIKIVILIAATSIMIIITYGNNKPRKINCNNDNCNDNGYNNPSDIS